MQFNIRGSKNHENDPPTYFYCYYRLVCCYGRVPLGQRVSESDAEKARRRLPSRQGRPPPSNGPRAHWPSWRVYLKRLGEDSTLEFSVSGFGPKSFAVGDLDGDGDIDILVGDSFFGSTGISVLKNNGDQTFAAPVYYSLPQSQTVGEVALSDFDFDGDLDAFATIRGDFDQLTKIMVWRNNGDGTFAAPIEFPTGQGPAGIVIADFTGDGKPDVITANYGGSSISILRHNGLNGPRPVSSRLSVSTPQITRKKLLPRTSMAMEIWMWLSAKRWTLGPRPPLRL